MLLDVHNRPQRAGASITQNFSASVNLKENRTAMTGMFRECGNVLRKYSTN